MSEARWSQRVTTEDGVFERRRCLTAEERRVMRKKYREEEEDVFQDIPRLFTHKDVPGFEDMLKKRLQALQEVFKKTAQRNPAIVQQFFERYLLQVEDIDEAVEALTTLSYREDEEVHLFIRATPGTPAFQEARHAFIAKEVAHVLMEGFIDGNRDEFQTEPFIARTPEMVRVYRDWIEKKRESIRHQSESACERFYATSKELIEQGLLPLEPERVERCLKDLRIEVLDPFFGVTKELWGQHDSESHTILLDISIPEKAFYHVFAHEVMHALSGKTEVLNAFFLVEANPELDTNTTLYHVPRSGISFRKMVTDRPRNAEYTWLNEAITELCAEYFSHQTITYKEEQALLKLLRACLRSSC